MASPSAFLVSAIAKIRGKDVANNRATSEATMAKIGQNLNALIDLSFYDEEFSINGFFNPNSYDDGVGGMSRVEFDSDIISYQFSIGYTGISGSNIMNAEIRDEAGVLIGNLFGSGVDRVLIPGSNRSGVLIGKDVVNDSNFANNLGASIPQYGDLNFTTLLEGWTLRPFIESNVPSALHAKLKIRLRGA